MGFSGSNVNFPGDAVPYLCEFFFRQLQHLFYKLLNVIWLITVEIPAYLKVIIYLALYAAIMVAVWYIFARQLNEENYTSLENRKNIVLCAIVLLCTIFFNIIYVYYGRYLPRYSRCYWLCL